MALAAAERKRSSTNLEKKLVQAVRNSLNLPRLRVRARRSRTKGGWLVCIEEGKVRSEWLLLDLRALAVIRKVGHLPPMLLGIFRLAYDSITNKELR